MKPVKGLNRQTDKQTHRHRQHYDDYQGKGVVGELEKEKGGINGDGRRLDFGW